MAIPPSPPNDAGESVAEVSDLLRRGSRRVTGARETILRILRRERRPMSPKEILSHMGADRCNLSTVYRTVELLSGMEMVKRFDFGDGVARYELLCGPAHRHHHHHLVCNQCWRVVELDECFPEEFERSIASRNGFTDVTHSLEFFGVCPACQSKPGETVRSSGLRSTKRGRTQRARPHAS